MTKTRLIRHVILALAVLFMIGVGSFAYAFCNTYHNSRAAWISNQAVCAYSGSTCTECIIGGAIGGVTCASDTAGGIYCSDNPIPRECL